MKIHLNKISLRLSLICLALLILGFAATERVYADGSPGLPPATQGSPGKPPSSTITTLQNPLAANSLGEVINSLVDIFAYIVILFAVLAIIWTGFQFITARGSSDKLKELKNRLLYIVIGVAIVIGARIIIRVVITTLEASGAVSPQVINSAQNALNVH